MAATAGNPAISNQDPFAAQRTTDNDPFASSNQTTGMADSGAVGTDSAIVEDSSLQLPDSPTARDRRQSREWDAAKVPPSQFQKRKGSIYATPGSRDSHHHEKERDAAYHEKIKESGEKKKWGIFSSKK